MAVYPQRYSFPTDELFYKTISQYSGIQTDIIDTQVFLPVIDLSENEGIETDFFIYPDNGIDDFVIKLFRLRFGESFTGTEEIKRDYIIENPGATTELRKHLKLNESGLYRYSIESEGSSTVWSVNINGRYWKYEIVTV